MNSDLEPLEAFSTEDLTHQIGAMRDLMNDLAKGSHDPADHAMLAAAVMYTMGSIGHLTDRLNEITQQVDEITQRLVRAGVTLWAPEPTPPAPNSLPLAEKG